MQVSIEKEDTEAHMSPLQAPPTNLGRPIGQCPEWSKAEIVRALPDFSGSWLCINVEGDMDAFLQDMGLNEDMRMAARGASYGIGRQVQNIAQSGNCVVVQNIFKDPVTMRFVVDEGVQNSVDQEGNPILVDPWWDGEVLFVASRRLNGDLIARTRRFYDHASNMVLEFTSPQGTAVKRIFSARHTEPKPPL